MNDVTAAKDETELLRRLHESPQLFVLIESLGNNELANQKRLRSEFPDDLVRAGLQLAELRRRAAGKFTRAADMWFDRTGLEQSTSEPIAAWKARRFPVNVEVADLCSGIGADAIALTRRGPVIGVDQRAAAGLMSRWNAEAYGTSDRLRIHTGSAENFALAERPFHVDPDRRRDGKRSLRIEDHQPALEFLQQLSQHPTGGAIKLSPASNFGGKFPGCEIELISLSGECKEAIVWCGPLRTETDWRATVLPGGHSLTGDPWNAVSDQSDLLDYIHDPDPAVVRSGLVDVLCETTGLKRLDREEEYLTGNTRTQTPFAQMFQVLAKLPNNEREIRSWFREADCGQVEIKCRRIPISPENLRRRLPLSGTQALTLIFARLAGRVHAIVCRRMRTE